jgi:hypothetical protein
MAKTSSFAAEQRQAKLNKLSETLRVMEQHIDFAALAKEIDFAAPRCGRERGGRPLLPTALIRADQRAVVAWIPIWSKVPLRQQFQEVILEAPMLGARKRPAR